MEYFEAPLKDYVEGPPPAALSTPVPAAVATEQLRIERMMSLKMMELKEELRKRGRSMVGKKGVLQDRLREAILLNVPVDFGNEAHHHESMSGLDVTAQWQWVLLTPDGDPFSQLKKCRSEPRPPHRDGWYPESEVCNEGEVRAQRLL